MKIFGLQNLLFSFFILICNKNKKQANLVVNCLDHSEY